MIKTKIYSPKQIYISAFLGGPFAMVFVLKKNFDAIGNKSGSKKTIIFGLIFNILVFASLPFLPKNFPQYILPIVYSVVAMQIAEKYQMSKKAILDSQQYGFQSNWRVLGISVAALVVFFVLFALWMFGLDALGIIHLDDY
jgi:hypothetical protein